MNILTITSPANPIIREAVKTRENRHRFGDGRFIIEGYSIVETAITAGAEIRTIFLSDRFREHSAMKQLTSTIRKAGKGTTKIIATTDVLIDRITDTATPQGIAAIATLPSATFDSLHIRANPLFLLCDNVRDPGNLGTLVRTADGAGCDGVIVLRGSCDPFSPKAIRSSAGSIFHIPVLQPGPDELFPWLKSNAVPVYIADARGKTSVYDADLTGPAVIVLGNESRGTGTMTREQAKAVISIPLPGRAESLNVAIAGGIILFEAIRQRKGFESQKDIFPKG